MLLLALLQADHVVGSTVIAKPTDPAGPTCWVTFQDEAFLYCGRDYGKPTDPGGNTVPGFFVHSKKVGHTIRVLQISTAGRKFGKSSSADPEVQKKMRTSSV
jgi:hypothetical protein